MNRLMSTTKVLLIRVHSRNKIHSVACVDGGNFPIFSHVRVYNFMYCVDGFMVVLVARQQSLDYKIFKENKACIWSERVRLSLVIMQSHTSVVQAMSIISRLTQTVEIIS